MSQERQRMPEEAEVYARRLRAVLENPEIPDSTKEVLKAGIDAALKMQPLTEPSQQIATGQINTELRDALKEPTVPVESADTVRESVEKFEKHIVDCWNDAVQRAKDHSDFVNIFERSLKSLVQGIVIILLPNALIGIKAPEKSGKSWYIVFRGHPRDGLSPAGSRFYPERISDRRLNEVRLIKPAALEARVNDWWHPDINKEEKGRIYNIGQIAEYGEFRPI